MSYEELETENRLLSQSLTNALRKLEVSEEQVIQQSQADSAQISDLKSKTSELESQLEERKSESILESNEFERRIYLLETENQALQQRSQMQQTDMEYGQKAQKQQKSRLVDVIQEILRFSSEAQDLALPGVKISVTNYEITGDPQVDGPLSEAVARIGSLATSIRALKEANRLIRERLRDSIEDAKAENAVLEKEKEALLRDTEALRPELLASQRALEDCQQGAQALRQRNDLLETESERLVTQLNVANGECGQLEQTNVHLETELQELEVQSDELKSESESAGRLLGKFKLENSKLKAENDQMQRKLLAFASADLDVAIDADECCDLCCRIESEGLEQYLAERLIEIGVE